MGFSVEGGSRSRRRAFSFAGGKFEVETKVEGLDGCEMGDLRRGRNGVNLACLRRGGESQATHRKSRSLGVGHRRRKLENYTSVLNDVFREATVGGLDEPKQKLATREPTRTCLTADCGGESA